MIPNSDKGRELRRQIEKLYRQRKYLAELSSPTSIKLVSDAKKFMTTLAKHSFDELKIYDLFNQPANIRWFKFLSQISKFNCLIQKHNPARIERITTCLNKKRSFLKRYAFDQFGILFDQFDIICKEIKFKIDHVTYTQNRLDVYFNREE